MTLTGTLDSLHTFSDHVSRPAFTHACLSCPTFSAGHTCHNSSPSSHQRANLLFSSFLGKSSETTSMSYFATHVTWCQLHFDSTTAAFIPTHWYHQTSKYWRLLKITVDNIVIFTVKHYMFPKLIAINRDLTAQYFFFQCATCVCVCVCVWSPDLSTRPISCHNTVSEPSHCDIEPQLSTDKDNWCHYALHLVHCSCIPA